MSGVTIRELQTNLPWTIRYSRDFRASPQPHKDFAHALHHVGKALGRLHGLADDMDHDREVADDPMIRERHAKYVADLVVCALRLANTFPGGVVDLEAAVVRRIEENNGPPPNMSAKVPEPAPLFHQVNPFGIPLHVPDFVGTGPRRVTIDGLKPDPYDGLDDQNAETD